MQIVVWRGPRPGVGRGRKNLSLYDHVIFLFIDEGSTSIVIYIHAYHKNLWPVEEYMIYNYEIITLKDIKVNMFHVTN